VGVPWSKPGAMWLHRWQTCALEPRGLAARDNGPKPLPAAGAAGNDQECFQVAMASLAVSMRKT